MLMPVVRQIVKIGRRGEYDKVITMDIPILNTRNDNVFLDIIENLFQPATITRCSDIALRVSISENSNLTIHAQPQLAIVMWLVAMPGFYKSFYLSKQMLALFVPFACAA